MRIVTTSIMLNETPEFIERWARSAQDADERVLIDTGSVGDQIVCARDLGVTVHKIAVRPWRFDVARNAGLSLLPDCDIVITLDVDEVLEPGWRDALESAGPASRYSYHYQWNPDIWFIADRTYSRHGWIWKHPVHESLYRSDGRPEEATVRAEGMRITHLADDTKPRSSYLPLLELAVAEDPLNDRMAHYYARELYFHGHWEQARVEFMRHLALPTAVWPAERAQSYRYLAKMDNFPERWLLKAVAEDSDRREAWVDLAKLAASEGRASEAVGYVARALAITQPRGDYMTEASAWNDFELMAIVERVWDDSAMTGGRVT